VVEELLEREKRWMEKQKRMEERKRNEELKIVFEEVREKMKTIFEEVRKVAKLHGLKLRELERQIVQCFEQVQQQGEAQRLTLKRPLDPESSSSEKRARAPQTEKCTMCKERDAHCEIKEGLRYVFLSFVYSLFYFFNSFSYLQKV